MGVTIPRAVPSRAHAEEGGRKPSLLFVNQHYWPDVASTGQHLTDLAEYLAARGYDVHVLASRGRYVKGRIPAPLRERRNGVEIHRVRTTGFGRARVAGRLVDYATFYFQVMWALLAGDHGRRYDHVVFLTTPPLLSFLGAIARLFGRQRYGVWSMDLHPDAEVASGMLARAGLAARVLEWMHRVGLRHADFIIDLGAHMKRRIVSKGVAPERTHTVHVWNRREEVEPTERVANPLLDTLQLRDRFVVMYSGNAGIVHEFGPILDAMRALRDEPRLFWLFVGDGPRRGEIESHARDHAISNFRYREYFERDQLRYSLSVADVHLISLRKEFVGISVPGKLYGIMASGRPALFVGPRESDTGEAIIAANAGVVIDPGTGDAATRLVAELRRLMSDPGLREALGARGREAFLARYEREENCAAFEQVLHRARVRR
ncbi:MAG TPA: glycosyltransferase family 4 protein [Gemmatimonadaceae bacterium]|nr:glycosyltransferase family 4 protein [Gemmatimonadaceae bacterium]HEX2780734.1 glycosyltransferase family 4 protein [Gemmatimonadaceae bacterium]